jgi:hypothetical protein
MTVKVEQIEKNKVAWKSLSRPKIFLSQLTVLPKKLQVKLTSPVFAKEKPSRHIIERYVGKEYLQNEAVDPVLGTGLRQSG